MTFRPPIKPEAGYGADRDKADIHRRLRELEDRTTELSPFSGTIDAAIQVLSGSVAGAVHSTVTGSLADIQAAYVSLQTGVTGTVSAAYGSLQTGVTGSVSAAAAALSGTVNARFIRGKVQVYSGTGIQTVPLDADTAVLALAPAAELDMVGMTAGVDGRVVEVYNSGSANSFIYEEHASAAAADRFMAGLGPGGFGYLVSGGGMGVAVYDGAIGRWRFGWHLQKNTPTSLEVLGDVTTSNVFATFRLKGGTTQLGVLPSPYCDLTAGTVNNWNPHSGSPSGYPVYAFGIVDVSVATGLNTITGIDATYAQTGDLLVVINRTSYDMTFTNQDALSLAANRLNLSNTAGVIVSPGGSISFRYLTGVGWQQVSVATQTFTTLRLTNDLLVSGSITGSGDATLGRNLTVAGATSLGGGGVGSGHATTISMVQTVAGFIDNNSALTVRDGGEGAGIGAGIEFQGTYTPGSITAAALIKAMKTNGTNGDYSFDLVLGTRPNGGNLAEVLRLYDGFYDKGIKVLGDVKVTGSITGSGDATLGRNLTVNGALTVLGGLTASIIADSITVPTDLRVSGSITGSGDVWFKNNLKVDGSITGSGDVSFGRNVRILTGEIMHSGTVSTLNRYIRVNDFDTQTWDGAATAGSTLISRDTSLMIWQGGLVAGQFADGNVPPDRRTAGTFLASADITVSGSVTGSGDALFNRRVVVGSSGLPHALSIRPQNNSADGIGFDQAGGGYSASLIYEGTGGSSANWGLTFYVPTGQFTTTQALALRGNGGGRVQTSGNLEVAGSITGSSGQFLQRLAVGSPTKGAHLDVSGTIRSTVAPGVAGIVAGSIYRQWVLYPPNSSDLRLYQYNTTFDAGGGNDRVAFTDSGMQVFGSVTGSGDVSFGRNVTATGGTTTTFALAVTQGTATGVSNVGVANFESNASTYVNIKANTAAGETGLLFSNEVALADGAIVYSAGRNLLLRSGGNINRVTIDSAGTLAALYDAQVTGALYVQGKTVLRGGNTNAPMRPFGGVEFAVGRNATDEVASYGAVKDIALNWFGAGGGFRHWISTNHQSLASDVGNAIKFWLNDSTGSLGSTAPNTGSYLALSLHGDRTVRTSSSLVVAGSITGSGDASFGRDATVGRNVNVGGQLIITGQTYTTDVILTGTLRLNSTNGVDQQVIRNSGGVPVWGPGFGSAELTGTVADLFVQGSITGSGDVHFTKRMFLGDIVKDAGSRFIISGSDAVTARIRNEPAIAGDAYALQIIQGGGVSTTAQDRTSYGISSVVTTARIVGGNWLYNVAGYFSASNGQDNVAIWAAGGESFFDGLVTINDDLKTRSLTGSGDAIFSRNVSVAAAFTASDATFIGSLTGSGVAKFSRDVTIAGSLTGSQVRSNTDFYVQGNPLSATLDAQRVYDGLDPLRGFRYFDDYVTDKLSNVALGNGTNSVLYGQWQAGHPGIAKINVTTSGTAVADIQLCDVNQGSTVWLNGGPIEYECCFFNQNADDGTDNSCRRAGIHTFGVQPLNGIWIETDRSRFGDNEFRFITAATGSRTQQRTGVTMAANQWYRVRINVSPNGDAVTGSIWSTGTLLYSQGTLTYVPTNSAVLYPGVQAIKTLGSGVTHVMNVDYQYLEIRFTGSRA